MSTLTRIILIFYLFDISLIPPNKFILFILRFPSLLFLFWHNKVLMIDEFLSKEFKIYCFMIFFKKSSTTIILNLANVYKNVVKYRKF